jgi:two-component system nitrate/nitrite response regulator NarL
MIASRTTSRVRVLVADDHPLYREGVMRLISARPDFELVAFAEDGTSAIEQIRALAPDIAIVDVQMPGLTGDQVVAAVERDGLPTRVVLLSAHIDSETVYAAVASGAGAYLSKDASSDRISEAVMAVSRGEVVLSPEVQRGLADGIKARERDGSRPVLTEREHEVLVLTSNGRSTPQIAAELFISPSTVKTYLRTLYEKLDVSDRAAAVAEAMRRGLLE